MPLKQASTKKDLNDIEWLQLIPVTSFKKNMIHQRKIFTKKASSKIRFLH